MTRVVVGGFKAVAATAGIAAAYAICASIIFVAAVCTRGVSEAPDRGDPAGSSFESGWEITSFSADYTTQRDGAIEAAERIDVDFASVSKHGIFRDLFWRVDCQPPRITSEARIGDCPAGRLRTYDIDVHGVTDADGRPLQTNVSTVGDTRRIRIGDPDVLVTGKQTYVVRYSVRRSLDAYAGHEELYWNASGRWPVPIRSFSMTVRPPSGQVTEVRCFQGPAGSTETCPAGIGGDGVASYAITATLPTRDQVTIVAGFPKGTVTAGAPRLWHEPSYRDFYSLDAIEIGGTILVGLLAAAVLAGLWWRTGRDRQYRTLYYLTKDPSEGRRPLFGGPPVVVEFTPPEDLRPAQMGLLLDERADPLDVTATIIDLAVRGYLRIDEIPGHVRDGKDWRFTRLKEADKDLLPYERRLLFALFSSDDSHGTVRLSELENHFAERLSDAQEGLYKDAGQRGWFQQDPEAARAGWAWRGLLVFLAGLPVAYFAGLFFGRALVPNFIPVAGMALFPLSHAMASHTAKGSEALRRVLGFRLYIDTAETRQQEFNERAGIFARYLPYAIVFGSVTKWARAFRGLDDQVRESLDWYGGGDFSSGFAVAIFSSQLAGFSHGLGRTLAAPPIVTGGSSAGSSGSGFGGFGGFGGGGFGGGGFSGGGGGGGGGGSW